MSELSEFCRNLKKDFTPKIRDPTRPVRGWSEKDVLAGKIVDAFVIIFRTRGCSWALNSGCTMCGYLCALKIVDEYLKNKENIESN